MARRNRFVMAGVSAAFARVAAAAASAAPKPSDPEPVVEPDVEFAAIESLRDESAQTSVPWSVRVAAAVSWRMIVIAVAAAGLAWLAMQLYVIVLPIAIALLFAVLISPMVGYMHRKLHFPRALAAAVGLLVTLGVVLAALSGASSQIISQLPRLFQKATQGLARATEWIQTLPFAIDATYLEQIQTTVETEATAWLKTNSAWLASGAVSFTSSLVSILSGLLIVLFCLFFFLKDGRRIWIWVVRLFPEPARVPVHESAIRGWVTLGGYVRSQIQVAAIDSIGIGLGAYFLGVPMVIPIVVVVFFGSFVPILGALLSGSIAVLVALVDQGPMAGLIMLIVILVVQQVEGNLLQPLIMSNAVSLHPMAVLLVVAGCGTVAGIPGAVFGVPIAAFLNATMLYLHGYDPIPALATQEDRPGGSPGMLHEMIVASYRREGAAPVAPVEPVHSVTDSELTESAPVGESEETAQEGLSDATSTEADVKS